MKLSALFSTPRTNVVSSILTFPQIDIEGMARKLRIRERGREQGKRNLPFADSREFDAVEQEIANEIESEGGVQYNKYGTLKGQVTQLSGQIRAAGKGNEFPGCWVTQDGRIQSIFELELSASGVVVIDRNLPDRAIDRAALPLGNVEFDRELPLQVFLDELRPLYQWSVENKCRFHVIIYSTVASAPIVLVNAINGYFYPASRILLRRRG